MIKAIMFDLDGTLLPTDDKEFTKTYFKLLCQKFMGLGYDKDKIMGSVLKGVELMRNNEGKCFNREVFWNNFKKEHNLDSEEEMYSIFTEFYLNEFKQTKLVCEENPYASKVVKFCREKGLKTILSTSPFFPIEGVTTRLEFVGLKEDDFDYISYCDNSTYSKPNIKFYEEILNNVKLEPHEVIMFGNSEKDDGKPTKKLGIKTYMLGDYVSIDEEQTERFEHISFEQFFDVIEKEINGENN